MELNKKAAYLQGLVDGLGIDDTTKEGKIIKAMSALLGEMAEVIESVDEDLSRAYDLDAGEANCARCVVTFEVALEGDGEEDAEDGPVQYEVTCPDCGTTSVFEEDELLDGAPKCPNCGKALDFEVTEEKAPGTNKKLLHFAVQQLFCYQIQC